MEKRRLQILVGWLHERQPNNDDPYVLPRDVRQAFFSPKKRKPWFKVVIVADPRDINVGVWEVKLLLGTTNYEAVEKTMIKLDMASTRARTNAKHEITNCDVPMVGTHIEDIHMERCTTKTSTCSATMCDNDQYLVEVPVMHGHIYRIYDTYSPSFALHVHVGDQPSKSEASCENSIA